ncbi:MAG TPA: DUF3891 family protein [Solirubrobacteraceae bacterium]|jgi:hypothetical protein|nr:DUF3891 family protein [Solirubrobacteraceae bacterium]
MLVRDDVVIGQPAHAWISGQLARAWGNAGFPAPAPREPVCLAAEQHDVGWQDADLEPLRGEDGRPLSFIEYPRPAHIAIWRDAARRLLAQSRYAALLVSLHGTSLYERADPDEHPPEVAAAIRAYLRDERDRQRELAAGLDPEEVARNRRLIAVLDRLSLALCRRVPVTLDDVPGADGPAALRLEHVAAGAAGGDYDAEGGGRDDHAVPPGAPTAHATLAPWPFTAAALVVGCEGRRLGADGTIGDWVPLRFALSPG